MKKIILSSFLWVTTLGVSHGALVFTSSVTARATGGATSNITSPSMTDTNTNDLIIIACMNDYGDSNGAFSLATTNSGLTVAMATTTLGTLGQVGFYYACTGSGGFSAKTFTCNANSPGSPSIMVESWSGSGCTNASPALGIGNKNQQTKSTGQPTISKTTSADNSWVIGVGLNASEANNISAGASQFFALKDLKPSDLKVDWVIHQNAVTPTNGTSVTMSVSGITAGDDWDFAWLEIIPPVVSSSSPSGSSIQNTTLYGVTIK